MESLRENKALLYSLASTGCFIAMLAAGWLPEMSQQFEIVDFPEDVSSPKMSQSVLCHCLLLRFQFRALLLQVLAADVLLSLALDRFFLLVFGEGKLRQPR